MSRRQRLQGSCRSASISSSASHLPEPSPAQCEAHIWAPSKTDSAVALLPLTLDVSERRQAAQPISPEVSFPRPRNGNDLLGGGRVVLPLGLCFPEGGPRNLEFSLRAVTPFLVSWEPPGISLGLPDLLPSAKSYWTR